MFLFNLSLGEFLALLGISSSVVVALYLLDRSRRAVVVSTLKFWIGTERPVESQRRRRIRQWPSLLLQLIGIALLLLALAQLRLGSPDTTSRDHVLLLDTSAWMGARAAGSALMDQARGAALDYLRAVPATDRVMVVYADALATPQSSFESDRRKVELAIRSARPGNSALNLKQALDFSRQSLRRSARRPGEIVLAGGMRIETGERTLPDAWPANFRLLPLRGAPENTGIRRLGVRRAYDDAGLWRVLITLRNYGRLPQTAELAMQFGGAPAGARILTLAPGAEVESTFDLRTKAAGIVEVRIRAARDDFEQDNRAILELPGQQPLAVTVCTDQPDLLRPLLGALAAVSAAYRSTQDCLAKPPEGTVIYDRMVPAVLPENALFLDPAPSRSPVPVARSGVAGRLESWRPDHPVGAGLRAADIKLDSTLVFRPGPDDIAVAESEDGPVIVARSRNGQKLAVFGFHPLRSGMKFELAAPLLVANTLRWFAPESFGRGEMVASTAGTVSASVPAGGGEIKVTDERGAPMPFSVRGQSVRFFSGAGGTVRLLAGGRESVYSLTLPEVPESVWEPPARIRRGVPPASSGFSGASDLWPWLALLGGLALLADWLLYGPAEARRLVAWRRVAPAGPQRRAS